MEWILKIVLFLLVFKFFPSIALIFLIITIISWIIKGMMGVDKAVKETLLESKIKKEKFEIYFENTEEMYQGTIYGFVELIFILIYLDKAIISVDKLKIVETLEGREDLLQLLKKEDEISEKIKMFLENDFNLSIEIENDKNKLITTFSSKEIDTIYKLEMAYNEYQGEIKPMEDNYIRMFKNSKIKIGEVECDYTFIENIAYLYKTLKKEYIKINKL